MCLDIFGVVRTLQFKAVLLDILDGGNTGICSNLRLLTDCFLAVVLGANSTFLTFFPGNAVHLQLTYQRLVHFHG